MRARASRSAGPFGRRSAHGSFGEVIPLVCRSPSACRPIRAQPTVGVTAQPPRAMQHTRPMAELGYDSDFLDTTLAPPEPGQEPGGGAGEGALLDYQHFTVQMHATRRLAWWVAWNIDGLRLFPSDSISRPGEDF